jgi:hypothetical protein
MTQLASNDTQPSSAMSDWDAYLATLDDEEMDTWGIWRGDPPDPNQMWQLHRYHDEAIDGMHEVARVICTARQANRIFVVLSRRTP